LIWNNILEKKVPDYANAKKINTVKAQKWKQEIVLP
jgi:hypothetical protein